MMFDRDSTTMYNVSNFLRKNGLGHYEHFCPGCKHLHTIAVDTPFRNGARWSFDGNLDSPTFSPSINIRVGPYPDNDDANQGKPAGHIDVCHYFLKAGMLEFLSDCTHRLSGKTVPLPPLLDDPYYVMRIK